MDRGKNVLVIPKLKFRIRFLTDWVATTLLELMKAKINCAKWSRQTAEELGVRQDDGRSDRSKGGGLAANGQGKPKKGRTASSARDRKRTRPSSEQDFDDEDDPDMSLR
ncbi:putative Myb domain protein 13 [Hibiscus syriacus]|uniref:Myb domain protein 13 n=1 Tax=Hibiscus syriacus TaxID=106335 RepID=A0A6A2YKF6_HIBSY|nr:putative Myb domain protein 13 [Hibiscus syriacus]